LVPIRDLVADSDTLAIVTELVRGPSLRKHLSATGTLTPADAVSLTVQVLRGLAAVHDQGVIHCDVKPENVLLDTRGVEPVARLTDIGIARLAHGPSLTRLTGLIGRPEYLPPELAAGTHATPQADVYSAGIMLYELLCGVTPFGGGHAMAVLKGHTERRPGRIPGVPDELWEALLSMLAKQPSDRPPARQAADGLTRLIPRLSGIAALPALQAPPPSLPLKPPTSRKHTQGGCQPLPKQFDMARTPTFSRVADMGLFVMGALMLASGVLVAVVAKNGTVGTILIFLGFAALLLGALLTRLSGTIKITPTSIELTVIQALEATRRHAELTIPDNVEMALGLAVRDLAARGFLSGSPSFTDDVRTEEPAPRLLGRMPPQTKTEAPGKLVIPPDTLGDSRRAAARDTTRPRWSSLKRLTMVTCLLIFASGIVASVSLRVPRSGSDALGVLFLGLAVVTLLAIGALLAIRGRHRHRRGLMPGTPLSGELKVESPIVFAQRIVEETITRRGQRKEETPS
jgi:hypothetical protein